MDLYSQVIHKSRYARYLPEEGRRENWEETVLRLVNYLSKKVNRTLPATELYNAILNLEVMPSMRLLMTAGEACDRDNVAAYNPVTGDTKVVVRGQGNINIEELVGQDIEVLNAKGVWSEASVRSYGYSEINQVNLKLNSNTQKTVECTDNHRWVLQDGTVKSTSELTKGDKIDFISAPKPSIDDDYLLGVRHGIVYGDGTSTKSCERVQGYLVRLCGDSSELLSYFDGYPCSYPESANGDPVVYLYDGFAATHPLKELPSNEETDSYLLGFIRGWLAADGSVTKNSQVSLCVSSEGSLWLQEYSERLGFVIQRVYKQPSETNYGKRRKDSFVIYFSRSSMHKDDFLCSWKKDKFKELKSHYIVDSVVATNTRKMVYCAEVPDTNTFVLEGGLLTGNCSFAEMNGSGERLLVLTDEMKEAGLDEPVAICVSKPICFDEIMYILLCGTGVGFSCERQVITSLPVVGHKLGRKIYARNNKNFPGVSKDELSIFDRKQNKIFVADSKYGWASALRILIVELYNGNFKVQWDLSKIRPAGSPLKTFGGRASGPKPLNDLFNYCVNLFSSNKGHRLNSIAVHGLVCKIAEVVVVGGVRRSALISLSNLSDDRMRHAKSGNWWESHPEFALANNSIAYTEKPDIDTYMREMTALIESKSGERGIYNKVAAKTQASRWGRRSKDREYGTNPCSEIILRDKQFCNLTEVVVRATDTFVDLKRKVGLATILGTIQATLTDFVYLSDEWKKNTEEERLLGVSLTGIMDSDLLNSNHIALESTLRNLREHARKTNEEWSEVLGIPVSAAITCIKPSGTVSQLVNSASGIHARHASYYIRRIRMDKKDPMYEFLKEKGAIVEDDVRSPDTTAVFSFPIKAPEGAVLRNDRAAIEQLELWLIYQRHWCEHKPSITVSVKDEEWPDVIAWVWKHFDEISGVSFLPFSDHTYQQAPYEDCNQEEYERMLNALPDNISWEELLEDRDLTEGTQILACVSGSCEI